MNRIKICKELEEIQNKPEEAWKAKEGELAYYTNMRYWLPKILNIKNREFFIPKTVSIEIPDDTDLFHLLDYGTKQYKEPNHYHDILDKLCKAASQFSLPCFFRSGLTSGKHEWKHCCYIDNNSRKNIEKHLINLVNFSGFADLHVDYFVFREMIKTDPIFYFFDDMPITREFRFRLEGNDISHVQPYWPDEAFEKYDIACYTDDKRDKLRSISTLSTQEFFQLKKYTLSLREVLPEFSWSIDWLQDKNNNWWLTDMARAEHSYWWNPDFSVVTD